MDAIAGMTLMGIFMMIFTSSLVMMFRSSNNSQAVTHTSQQINNAFLWLERQIRYADYVSAPAQASADGNNWHVVFENTDPTTFAKTCYQLRVDQGSEQLQQRSWTGSGSATAWQPLATGVTNGGEGVASQDRPFILVPPSSSSSTSGEYSLDALPSVQLTVNLVTTEGQGVDAASSNSSVTLVAFNTDSNTPSSGTCTEMGT
jgi:hypothetical protein